MNPARHVADAFDRIFRNKNPARQARSLTGRLILLYRKHATFNDAVPLPTRTCSLQGPARINPCIIPVFINCSRIILTVKCDQNLQIEWQNAYVKKFCRISLFSN